MKNILLLFVVLLVCALLCEGAPARRRREAKYITGADGKKYKLAPEAAGWIKRTKKNPYMTQNKKLTKADLEKAKKQMKLMMATKQLAKGKGYDDLPLPVFQGEFLFCRADVQCLNNVRNHLFAFTDTFHAGGR